MKKKKKLHDLETLVVFSNLHDKISIKEKNIKKHKIKFVGKFSKNISKKNTISKLFKIMDTMNLLNKKKYYVKVTKNIPTESGLGGGSMNAATILKYLIKKEKLLLSKKKIIEITKNVGSDVILGMFKGPLILKKDKIFLLRRKIKLFLVIVKPIQGCSTKKIYKKINVKSKSILKKIRKNYTKIEFLKNLNNDLESAAFKIYPNLNNIKKKMTETKNILFVRMSGSGSSLVGYFDSKKTSINAAKVLQNKFKNYWCISSKTI